MEESENLREREARVFDAIKNFASRVSWQPPEVVRPELFNLFNILSEHFATSNANSEGAYVAQIIKKIYERCQKHPEVSEEIDRKLFEMGLMLKIEPAPKLNS